MRPIRVIACSAAAAAISISATAKPRIYTNAEYGIALPIASGELLCRAPKNEHDHGPALLLGTSSTRGCRDSGHHRSIAIFATYTIEAEDPPSYLNDECTRGAMGGPCQPAPAGLEIAGLASASARVNHPDGRIEIVVVAQAGTPDPAFDPVVPPFSYDLSLYTTPEHLEEDLRVFRTVLKTIRLSPPGK
jgi:hypothetical protein